MVNLTYLLLVVAVTMGLWFALGRPLPGRRSPAVRAKAERRGQTGERLRSLVMGSLQPSPDLVERLAYRLAQQTTVFGASYAIPTYLAAVLPKGIFEAASAVKRQLTIEVLERFTVVMTEQAHRLGRRGPDFALPPDYCLRVVLACGPTEGILASFEPIIDVHAALAEAGVLTAHQALPRAADVHVGQTTSRRPVEPEHPTTRRGRTSGPASATFVLTVDGMEFGQCPLGGSSTTLTIGRGAASDLRCPDDVSDVSRKHAVLTLAQGRVFAEDKGSANGTWLQRPGVAAEQLVAGEPVPVERGDTLWLDEDHRVKVVHR